VYERGGVCPAAERSLSVIKHVVFWRLKDAADDGARVRSIELIRSAVEGMRATVPGIRHIEVGADFERSSAAWDVALYSEFESREALDAYQVHPEHDRVRVLVGGLVAERAVVDYEA
jgi:quinol monooxygenase YgiN